jgi:hypothetical protein
MRRRIAGKLSRDDIRHVRGRRDEPAMRLRAFAEREDVALARAHVRADPDAPVDGQARLARERRVRADAEGHDHEISRTCLSSMEHVS